MAVTRRLAKFRLPTRYHAHDEIELVAGQVANALVDLRSA